MTHQQTIDLAMHHLKQATQINEAIRKDVLALTKLVDELSQENGRLRLALMRAAAYNGSSRQDPGE